MIFLQKSENLKDWYVLLDEDLTEATSTSPQGDGEDWLLLAEALWEAEEFGRKRLASKLIDGSWFIFNPDLDKKQTKGVVLPVVKAKRLADHIRGVIAAYSVAV